jgi:hypothetical protein
MWRRRRWGEEMDPVGCGGSETARAARYLANTPILLDDTATYFSSQILHVYMTTCLVCGKWNAIGLNGSDLDVCVRAMRQGALQGGVSSGNLLSRH